MKKLSFILIAYLIVGYNAMANAQSNKLLHVVVREEEKTLSNATITSLKIDGNKANVHIIGWQKSETTIHFKYTAKHTDKSIAENDVLAFYNEISQGKNTLLKDDSHTLYISYNVHSNKKKSRKTQMKCEIVIHTPINNVIILNNTFSNNIIEGINAKLDINLGYGSLKLNNIKGDCKLTCNFNDVTGNKLSLNLDANLLYSNFTIDGLENGAYTINGKYCNGILTNVAAIKKLYCKIDNGAIEMQALHPETFSYNVKTSASDISNALPASIIRKSKNTTYEFIYKPQLPSGVIKFDCLYTSIKLK